IKVELLTGIPAVLDTARRMGVTSLNQPDNAYGTSLTLGGYGVSPLDMVTGASTLATLGVRHRPAPILHIQDGLGKTKFNYDPAKNEFRAVSEQVAFIIDSIMSDDRNRCRSVGCGGDLTLPGRQLPAAAHLAAPLAGAWPLCRFGSPFHPRSLTDAQLTVNGLACVIYSGRGTSTDGRKRKRP